MPRRLGIFFGLAFFLLAGAALLLLAMLVSSGGAGTASSTLASGRSITAHSDSWYLAVSNSADTATIDTAGHAIVVAPDRLLLDGRTLTAIPVATKSVTVTVQRGTIAFVADGETVVTCPR